MIQYRANGVTVFQSALYQTTTTVIEAPGFVLVVDPTWLPNEVEMIRDFVTKVRGDRPLYLLFTHSDWDHIIGAGAFPDALTIASRAFVERPDGQDAIEQILDFDSRNYLRRDYDIAYPSVHHVIERDGQQLQVGEMTFTFYIAAGHTPCGLFTIIEPLGLFLAGDYLSDIEFPYMYYSSTAYEDTLRKVGVILNHHHVGLLVPGHGLSTTDFTEIHARKQAGLDYIATLRGLVSKRDQMAIDEMVNTYQFPRGMKRFHEDNQGLLKRELGLE